MWSNTVHEGRAIPCDDASSTRWWFGGDRTCYMWMCCRVSFLVFELFSAENQLLALMCLVSYMYWYWVKVKFTHSGDLMMVSASNEEVLPVTSYVCKWNVPKKRKVSTLRMSEATFVTEFDKRGHFAQNANVWHFSKPHHFKITRVLAFLVCE